MRNILSLFVARDLTTCPPHSYSGQKVVMPWLEWLGPIPFNSLSTLERKGVDAHRQSLFPLFYSYLYHYLDLQFSSSGDFWRVCLPSFRSHSFNPHSGGAQRSSR